MGFLDKAQAAKVSEATKAARRSIDKQSRPKRKADGLLREPRRLDYAKHKGGVDERRRQHRAPARRAGRPRGRARRARRQGGACAATSARAGGHRPAAAPAPAGSRAPAPAPPVPPAPEPPAPPPPPAPAAAATAASTGRPGAAASASRLGDAVTRSASSAPAAAWAAPCARPSTADPDLELVAAVDPLARRRVDLRRVAGVAAPPGGDLRRPGGGRRRGGGRLHRARRGPRQPRLAAPSTACTPWSAPPASTEDDLDALPRARSPTQQLPDRRRTSPSARCS